MLHSPHGAAHRAAINAEISPPPLEVMIRTFRDDDFDDVRNLYHAGLLTDSVNPPDPLINTSSLREHYLTRAQDQFWVAEAHGKVIACIALTESSDRVGHVRRLRVDHEWLEWHDGDVVRMLIARAAEHARLHEQLKLVMHTPVHDERAVAFLHKMGFEFARIRDRDGKHLIEFYLNIYDASVPRHRSKPS